jgi:hypothetical protein
MYSEKIYHPSLAIDNLIRNIGGVEIDQGQTDVSPPGRFRANEIS